MALDTIIFDGSPPQDPPTPDPKVTLADPRVYRNTYIRIRNAYPDWKTADADAFYAELEALFTSAGFDIQRSRYGAPNAVKDGTSIYCHPQNLSGWMVEADVPALTDHLSQATTFRVVMVDGYKRGYNYTPGEFAEALAASHDAVRELLLTKFRTKRRNLYIPDDKLVYLQTALGFFRSGVIGSTELEKMELGYIRHVMNELVDEGRIFRATKGYRTLYRTRTARDGAAS